MNGRIDNVTLNKHEYELIVAYRKCTDVNFKNAICKLLDINPQINKVVPISKIK